MPNDEQRAARMLCVGFEGTSISEELRDFIRRGVSAVILFDRNYESPAQLRELCAEVKSLADRPILICTDHEGGRVQRFRTGFSEIPTMRELGEDADFEWIYELGRRMASELRAINIDMNLAPVLDVDTNPLNPVIGNRSFSGDPDIVASCTCTMIDGLQSAGIAACGKHFPGHGDTELDSHTDLPRTSHGRQRLDMVELVPFRRAIERNVAAIMTAHVVYDAIDSDSPATMSRIIVNGLLRNELGFQGVILSDDLEMEAISANFPFETAVAQSIEAGVDLLIVSRDHTKQQLALDALRKAIETDTISRTQLDESARRFDQLIAQYVKLPQTVNQL